MKISDKFVLTRAACERVGCAKHGTASLDGIETLPNHCDYWTSRHVLDKTREERLALEIGVV